MFVPGSCDIGFFYSNMRVEANKASYDVELKTQDFETQVKRHDDTRNLDEGVKRR